MNENYWKNNWSLEEIQAILFEQFSAFWNQPQGIPRKKLNNVLEVQHLPHSVIISGLRRVGKSTLLSQAAHQLGKTSFYYLNFEDERFIGFSAADMNDLFQIMVENFGERKNFIIDEIQNVDGWEHFVRRFMDMGYKFFITGSNASLLSRELGNRLTGRYISIELFPFSFAEYLSFTQHDPIPMEQLTTIENAKLNAVLFSYLKEGGIPDALKYPELSFNHSLYQDILFRDIAARYNLEAITALKELSFFLMSNPSGLISFNKLKERLHLGSVNTISSYIEYLENSWLIFVINKYSFSVKQQQIAPKKVYAIDTGMIRDVGFNFSEDTGKLLENLVFLTLRKNSTEVFYYITRKGYEVDFYLPQKKQLIQVSYEIDQAETREREIRSLIEAGKELGIDEVLILSKDSENTKIIDNMKIRIQSSAKWLLEQEYV